MKQNKIIIGILIFILVGIIAMMIYLLLTKDQAEERLSNKEIEISEEESLNIEMATNEIFNGPHVGEEVAIINIKDYGTLKVKFFKDVAPKAVENFIGLSKKGYYENVTFHRVIEDFMIQGGDPTGTGTGGESYFGSEFGPEYKDGYFPYKGTLCMASKPGVKNSLSSQFFIVQSGADSATEEQAAGLPEVIANKYLEVGGSAHLYKEYTVFGYVYEGMNIVDKIAKTKTDDNDKPLKDIIIKSVKIEQTGE